MERDSSKDGWINGWVGVLDILGFRERLKGNAKELAKTYAYAVKQAYLNVSESRLKFFDGDKKYPLHTKIKIFSDSIFVMPVIDGMLKEVAESHNEGERESLLNSLIFHNVMRVTRSIGETLLMNGLYFRGALSFGELFLDDSRRNESQEFDNSIYLGNAIVRADEWEKQQEWVWLSVSPESIHHIPEDIKQLRDEVTWASVPTSEGFVNTMVPLVDSVTRGSLGGQRGLAATISKALADAYKSGDPKRIRRWCNTAGFVEASGIVIEKTPEVFFESWERTQDGRIFRT